MTKSSFVGPFLMDYIESAPERQNLTAIPIEHLMIRTGASVGEVLVPKASAATMKLALQMTALAQEMTRRREELKKGDSHQAIEAFEKEVAELITPAIAITKMLFQIQMRLDMREAGVDSTKFPALAIGEKYEIIGYHDALMMRIDSSISEAERTTRAAAV